jgi:hypothetical protein
MNYTYELVIYTAQVIVFQLLATPYLSLFTHRQTLGKNEEWVRENSEKLEKFGTPNVIVSKGFGFLFLGVIGYGAIRNDSRWPFEVAHYGSVLVLLIQTLVYDLLRAKRISAIIPLPTKRSAEIMPRRVSDFIPLYLFVPTIAGMLFSLGGWSYLYLRGTLSHGEFLATIISYFFAFGVLLTVLFLCLNRKPIQGDFEAAKLYRKSEILVTFYVFLALVIESNIKLIGHGFHLELLINEKVSDYVFTLTPMGIFLWFLFSKNMKKFVKEERLDELSSH